MLSHRCFVYVRLGREITSHFLNDYILYISVRKKYQNRVLNLLNVWRSNEIILANILRAVNVLKLPANKQTRKKLYPSVLNSKKIWKYFSLYCCKVSLFHIWYFETDTHLDFPTFSVESKTNILNKWRTSTDVPLLFAQMDWMPIWIVFSVTKNINLSLFSVYIK